MLVLTLSIISYNYFQDIQEEKRQWKTFINKFYFSIDGSLNRIDNLIEHKPENEELEKNVHALEREFLKASGIVNDAHSFLNYKLHRTLFFREVTYYLYGINMTGTINAEFPPLEQDGKLDERELSLLKVIRGYLEEAKEEMYSKKTGQENPNLTLEEINKIITTHLNNGPYEIYKDAFY